MVTANYARYLKLLMIHSLSAIIIGIIFTTSYSSSPSYAYAKIIGNPLVYHLTSDEPWRATVAISDANTMLKLGHNVTLWLSIEGVQIGVKHPHQYLGLDLLTRNVTNFIANGGRVIICEVCLRIAGYSNSDIIDGAIIGKPEIISNLLSNATVVSY
ncbi:MAG: DsrE family protein [Candidatus Nitrosopolaris sp.]